MCCSAVMAFKWQRKSIMYSERQVKSREKKKQNERKWAAASIRRWSGDSDSTAILLRNECVIGNSQEIFEPIFRAIISRRSLSYILFLSHTLFLSFFCSSFLTVRCVFAIHFPFVHSVFSFVCLFVHSCLLACQLALLFEIPCVCT